VNRLVVTSLGSAGVMVVPEQHCWDWLRRQAAQQFGVLRNVGCGKHFRHRAALFSSLGDALKGRVVDAGDVGLAFQLDLRDGPNRERIGRLADRRRPGELPVAVTSRRLDFSC
jgi:hypothetical protein